MADLFNKKMDVLDIKLTAYGKKLYVEGKFDPCYYSFHDDEILYDRTYTGLEENASYDPTNADITNKFGNWDIDRRISDSLSFRVQPNKYSVDDPSIEINKNLKDNISDLYSFIGTSEFENQDFPAFDFKLFRGNLTGSVTYTTGSTNNHRNPQIHIEVTDVFDDVSKSFKTDEYFMIRIRELNSIFEKENFEIEVYEVEDEYIKIGFGETRHTQANKQLNFLPIEFTSEDVDPIYFSNIPTNVELVEGLPQLDDSSVDYFFKIILDKDILNDLIYESFPDLPEVIEIQQGIKFC